MNMQICENSLCQLDKNLCSSFKPQFLTLELSEEHYCLVFLHMLALPVRTRL